MKIKLVVYSGDRQYVEHLVNYLNIHHNEMIELNIFDNIEALDEYFRHNQADIILLDDGITWETQYDTTAVYLTEAAVTGEDRTCIFKYQAGDLIYRTILNIYASAADKGLYTAKKGEKEDVRIHLCLPLHGGAGASTVAKAYALKLSEHKKTLYLNLEIFGNCERVLNAAGNLSLANILYALKRKRGNLALKLESSLKVSREGIAFYAPSDNPLDLLELTGEEFGGFLSELKRTALFDEIVLDMDNYPSERMLTGLREADDVWVVAEGTGVSDEKYDKFHKFIEALEQKKQYQISYKIKIFYNKYRSRTGAPIKDCEWKTVGGSPLYEGMDEKMIIKTISESLKVETVL